MSNQLSRGATQPILDALYDLKELEHQAVAVAQSFVSLANLIKNEHFSTQEVVREELLKSQQILSGVLNQPIIEVWDNSIFKMPEEMSQEDAERLVASRSVEIRNLLLKQESQ